MERSRFASDVPPDDGDPLENDPTIGYFLAALEGARYELAEPLTPENEELRRDPAATAEDVGCSVFTAMVLNLLAPNDGPEYAIVFAEGAMRGPVVTEPLRRDVVRGYTCLTTPEGEWIERGPSQHDDERGWHYVLQKPDDPRLLEAIALTILIGAPHVNG